MKKRILSTAVAAAFVASSVVAQITVKTEAGDVSVRFVGRTNLELGTYIGQDVENVHTYTDSLGKTYTTTTKYNTNGLILNDTRFGFQVSFAEKWAAKCELQFGSKAAKFRDLWISYKLSDNATVKAGNYFQPFGAKVLGSLNYKFIENARADNAITPDRKIGITYSYISDLLHLTGGLASNGDVDAPSTNQGVIVAAKGIIRPILDDHTVLHIGVAGMFTKQDGVTTSYKATMPETFSSSTHTLISQTVDAGNAWRYEAEALFITGPFYIEGHYLGSLANVRNTSNNFNATGLYAQAGFLLIGDQEKYNKKTGLAATAPAGSLELLARVNYLKLEYPDVANTEKSETDITIGLNYFINKNLNIRGNYVYAKVKDGDDFNSIQARLQFSF